MKMTVKEKLIAKVPQILGDRWDIKHIELSMDIQIYVTNNKIKLQNIDIVDAMYEAAKRGLILEVELVSPDAPHKIRSLFFHKNTIFLNQ